MRNPHRRPVERLGAFEYGMTDYWTDEPLEIDDKIFLATSAFPISW
jgi:hypothetical protein